MKKWLIFAGVVLAVALIAGCTNQPQLVGNDSDEHGCKISAGYSWCEEKQKCIRPWEENCTEIKACTEEAKICPDGITTVTRNSSNNCEFDPCPGTGGVGMANPASVFCQEQGGESKILTAADGSQSGICVLPSGVECDEWAYFRGECPEPVTCTEEQKAAEACTLEYMPVCGDDGVTYGNKCAACASKKISSYTPGECPSKTYITRDLEQCKVIRYLCIQGKEPFTDEFGCGCQPVAEQPTDGKLKANDCTEPRTQACTKEYVPVCGWRDVTLECNYPPCRESYGNKCMACADETVAYWTEGECPE